MAEVDNKPAKPDTGKKPEKAETTEKIDKSDKTETKSKLVKDAQRSRWANDHRSFHLTKSVRGPFSGFMDFVREQGVVGLAVGLTLGTAVTVFVKSIVDSVINPVIGSLLPGSSELSSKYTCLHHVNGACTNKLGWGAVTSNFISFVIIALLVYLAVHSLKLDRLDKKKDQ